MHCKDWEERIALHVGGDLAAANAAEAAQVEKHLAECADCQAFWSGMKESLKLLQGAHSEALASGAYTAVRARVMAGLEAEPSAGRAWRGAWLRWIPVGLAAVVAVILVLAWPARQLKTLPPRVVAVIPPTPVGQGPRPEPARNSAHLPHAARRQVAATGTGNTPRQPLLVRLITDDPNVVIYWIAD